MAKLIAWNPKYDISPKTAKHLMGIESICRRFDHDAFPLAVESELRRQARMRSTHFSTRIEGNRLTLAEVGEAVAAPRFSLPNRERDVKEVQNYWNALAKVEEWVAARMPVTEDLIRRIHALVHNGKRAKPTPYRDSQNVIRDSRSGGIVYMPPESKDVPQLMKDMVAWIESEKVSWTPAPIVAALAHYQFVTIHPYYDGNGRTARLLSTFILQREGYGMNGCLSVEEQHYLDLAQYYEKLNTHEHHNYYEGRETANLTEWVAYYIEAVLEAAKTVNREIARIGEKKQGRAKISARLRALDPRARRILALFGDEDTITANAVAAELGLSTRMARELLSQWVKDGWLLVANESKRKRAYALPSDFKEELNKTHSILEIPLTKPRPVQ